MHYVYILINKKDSKCYIGFTKKLNQRLDQHKYGKVPSTKNRRPLKLIYFEAHYSIKDAKRREHYFKTNKGKSTIKQMLRYALKINRELILKGAGKIHKHLEPRKILE